MPLKIYRQKASFPGFWEKHWEESLKGDSLKKYYKNSKNAFIFREIFNKYLPKEGKILEAGCGLGTWVYLLKQRGYDIEGIDFAKETINFLKLNLPEIPVKVDDVFNLSYLDNFFKAYLSFGVVEHFEEGPEKILKEANRVLDKNGIIILSVPYFNPLRKLKRIFGFYRNKKGDFYQYVFTKNEIKGHLERSSFKIIKTYPYNVSKGLRDEVWAMKNLHQFFKKQKDKSKKRIVKKSETQSQSLVENIINSFPIRFLFSHMIIVVAKKI